MNKPYTVAQLFQMRKDEIQKGNGDKFIMISADDEGNDYHYLWYSFTPVDEYLEEYINENVAKKEDTIILG